MCATVITLQQLLTVTEKGESSLSPRMVNGRVIGVLAQGCDR